MRAAILGLCLALVLVTGLAAQERPVDLRLELEPGDGLVLASVRIAIRKDWKLYAADATSGLPLEVDWDLPPGWTATATEWPRSRRRRIFGIDARVYEEVVRVRRRLVPADPGTLEVRVVWAACREVCIRGVETLRAELQFPGATSTTRSQSPASIGTATVRGR